MKHGLILIATLFALLTACQAQSEDAFVKEKVDTLEYTLYPENILSFVYQDGVFWADYVIKEPQDPVPNCIEFEEYVPIQCTKALFFEYLNGYIRWTEDKNNVDYQILLDCFQFEERVTPVPGGLNYQYFLVRKSH